jgi:2'-5' RNA ligase
VARLFVAVRPPPATLDLIASIPRPEQPGARGTPRDQWHVTLVFLAEARLDEVRERLARLSAPATMARIEGAASISPRVWALRVGGLDAVAADVHDVLGVTPDRPFRGHLTLARVRRGRLSKASSQVPPEVLAAPAASFDVREVELVRSELSKDGARHAVELVVPLTSAG